jgi:hypothetical protein
MCSGPRPRAACFSELEGWWCYCSVLRDPCGAAGLPFLWTFLGGFISTSSVFAAVLAADVPRHLVLPSRSAQLMCRSPLRAAFGLFAPFLAKL